MKKIRKTLALLTAGLLLLGTLLACESEYELYDEDEDEQSEKEDSSEKEDKKEVDAPESPEDFKKHLEEDDDLIFSYCWMDNTKGDVQALTYIKDGNKLKQIRKVTENGETVEVEAYLDSEKGISYSQANDVWTTASSEADWDSLMENIFTEFPFFSNEDYTKEDDQYTMNEDAFPEGDHYDILESVCMTREDSTAVILMTFEDESTIALSLTLGETEITFPEVSVEQPSTGGVALPERPSPDPAPNPEPDPDPEPEPEPEPQPGIPSQQYTYMNPSEVYKALVSASDIGLTASIGDQTVSYEKTGDYLCLTVIMGDVSEIVYIDLSTGDSYALVGDEWQIANKVDYTWEELLVSMGLTEDNYLFVDENYVSLDRTLATFEIKPALLEGSEVASSTMQRFDKVYCFYESDHYGNTSMISINFENMYIELPV